MINCKPACGGGSRSRARSRARSTMWHARILKPRPKRTIKNGLKAWLGCEQRVPLTWQQKDKLKAYIRGLTKRRTTGCVWGVLTGKQADIGCYLVDCVNRTTGMCCPSYVAIRDDVGCCNRTIGGALDALEAAGIMRRIHRVVRRPTRDALAGITEVLVHRVSNGYVFTLPEALRPAKAQEAIRNGGRTYPTRRLPVDQRRPELLSGSLLVYDDATSWRGNPISEIYNFSTWAIGMDVRSHPSFQTMPNRSIETNDSSRFARVCRKQPLHV